MDHIVFRLFLCKAGIEYRDMDKPTYGNQTAWVGGWVVSPQGNWSNLSVKRAHSCFSRSMTCATYLKHFTKMN